MMTDPPDRPENPSDTLVMRPSHLSITWPDGSQETYFLESEVVRVGRGRENNDIAAPNEFKSISRKHMEIRREGAGFRIVDLGSINGCRLNGTRIENSAALNDQDVIEIGSQEQQVRLVLHLGSEILRAASSDVPEPGILLTEIELPGEPPMDQPYLQVRWPDGQGGIFVLDQAAVLIGRSEEADLRIPASERYVSNKHALIEDTSSGFTITDLRSSNGTRVNNQRLAPEAPAPLTDQDIIRIGDEDFGNSIGMTFFRPAEPRHEVSGFSPAIASPTQIVEETEFLIGRHADSDILLDSPDVSRRHARVVRLGDVFQIEDLGSTNGTYLNRQRISKAELHDGDQVQIGAHALLFDDGRLLQYQSRGMRLDVVGLSKDVRTRAGRRRILHDVHMSVLPREFIAIVGGSGAGKSTLMNALIGFNPGEGKVRLNGFDFYQEYERFRSHLGYVPQSDILHSSLTVAKALHYASLLRLPADSSAADRKQAIDTVLEIVSMNTEDVRKTRISNLSGGQRKRVSIAAELLADPRLIFLDEATSGLDPGLEKKMMHTLRRMADEGRTVILITHATTNIVQTDHVAFLSQGRLVYFGPSREALGFFEVQDFADIYERIERHGEAWQGVFHKEKPHHHQQYVLERQASRPPAVNRDLPRLRFGLRDFIRQFSVLTQRAMSVLMSDWFTLVLMLLLFPLTATLQLIIATPEVLVGEASILADPVAAAKDMVESYLPFADLNTFVFVMGLEAALVGMYVPSNELIKERSVYLRERMVNLKVLPYLLSKIAVFTLFAAIQTFLYLLVLSLGVALPDEGPFFPAPVELFISLFLAMTAGMGIGFVVSAVSRSSDMAIYALVILLFFQFFFAGTVFDLREKPAEALSYMTITRWTLTALGVTIDMEEQVEATILCNDQPDNPLTPEVEKGTICFNYPEATDDLMLPYDDENLLRSWGVLIFMNVLTLAITGVLIKRLDKT